jgi:hypothetical protein
MRGFALLGALLALLLAGLAALIGLVTEANICETSCTTRGLVTAQLVLALLGLVPAVILLLAVALHYRRVAVTALIVGVLIYGAWGLLNDAAVHGWSNSVLGS